MLHISRAWEGAGSPIFLSPGRGKVEQAPKYSAWCDLRPHSHRTRKQICTQICVQTLWCCLQPVWTLPLTAVCSLICMHMLVCCEVLRILCEWGLSTKTSFQSDLSCFITAATGNRTSRVCHFHLCATCEVYCVSRQAYLDKFICNVFYRAFCSWRRHSAAAGRFYASVWCTSVSPTPYSSARTTPRSPTTGSSPRPSGYSTHWPLFLSLTSMTSMTFSLTSHLVDTTLTPPGLHLQGTGQIWPCSQL